MPKNHRYRKKPQKSLFKRLIIYLVYSLLLLFLAVVFGYYFVLPSVFSNPDKAQNILIVSTNLNDQSSDIALVHLSKNKDENLMLVLNGDQVVNVGQNYGQYSLNSVYQLLKIDNKSNQMIKSVFSNIVNLVIDDIVEIDAFNTNYVKDNKLKYLFIKNLFTKFNNSFLAKKNLLKLYFVSNSITKYELSEITDLDDFYYQLSTVDKQLFQNCSVSVVNTTSKNGLASRVGKIIENTGGQIIRVESQELAIAKSVIYYSSKKPECQELSKIIAQIFPYKPGLKFDKQLPKYQQYRSDIVIMIGDDY